MNRTLLFTALVLTMDGVHDAAGDSILPAAFSPPEGPVPVKLFDGNREGDVVGSADLRVEGVKLYADIRLDHVTETAAGAPADGTPSKLYPAISGRCLLATHRRDGMGRNINRFAVDAILLGAVGNVDTRIEAIEVNLTQSQVGDYKRLVASTGQQFTKSARLSRRAILAYVGKSEAEEDDVHPTGSAVETGNQDDKNHADADSAPAETVSDSNQVLSLDRVDDHDAQRELADKVDEPARAAAAQGPEGEHELGKSDQAEAPAPAAGEHYPAV